MPTTDSGISSGVVLSTQPEDQPLKDSRGHKSKPSSVEVEEENDAAPEEVTHNDNEELRQLKQQIENSYSTILKKRKRRNSSNNKAENLVNENLENNEVEYLDPSLLTSIAHQQSLIGGSSDTEKVKRENKRTIFLSANDQRSHESVGHKRKMFV